MVKRTDILKFLLLLAAVIISLQSTSASPAHARSLFSWLRGDDEAKTEETIVPGYKPLLGVHKYNGIQIQPVNGGPPVYFESPTPVSGAHLVAGSDQQIVNLLYSAAPLLPEEEKLHEFQLGPFQPYLQMIPDASIDRIRVTVETDGEERIGATATSKLLKLLQIIKEKKLQPIKALYETKKKLIETGLNFLHPTPPPPPPHPVHPVHVYPLPPPPPPPPMHVYPPPPPPASDTFIIPSGPSVFALPPPPPPPPPSPIYVTPPPVFMGEMPSPPALHLLPPPPPPQYMLRNRAPEFSSFTQGAYFEHPMHQELRENVFDADKKHLCEPHQDKCDGSIKKGFTLSGEEGPYFHSANSDDMPGLSLSPPPSHTMSMSKHKDEDSPTSFHLPTHFASDLQTAASENEEKFSESQVHLAFPNKSETVTENRSDAPTSSSILSTPVPVVTTITSQSYKSTEPSTQPPVVSQTTSST